MGRTNRGARERGLDRGATPHRPPGHGASRPPAIPYRRSSLVDLCIGSVALEPPLGVAAMAEAISRGPETVERRGHQARSGILTPAAPNAPTIAVPRPTAGFSDVKSPCAPADE